MVGDPFVGSEMNNSQRHLSGKVSFKALPIPRIPVFCLQGGGEVVTCGASLLSSS